MAKILNCRTCKRDFDRREYDVGRYYCSLACSFLARVDTAAAGCWIWTSKKCKHGYAVLKWKNEYMTAHRVGYAITHNVSDFGTLYNTCGNRLCVRGDHWVEKKK